MSKINRILKFTHITVVAANYSFQNNREVGTDKERFASIIDNPLMNKLALLMLNC